MMPVYRGRRRCINRAGHGNGSKQIIESIGGKQNEKELFGTHESGAGNDQR